MCDGGSCFIFIGGVSLNSFEMLERETVFEAFKNVGDVLKLGHWEKNKTKRLVLISKEDK